MIRASRDAILPFVFFFSGCAALLFETLWFRQAALALGSAVWSTTVVLGAFMAGLALGSILAARRGTPLRPLAWFAVLEVLVGLGGLAVVWLLPSIGSALGPWLGAIGQAWLLTAARLAIAFVLLVGPATGMGATLPVLVGALGRGDSSFGRVLGRLYGWNTLGAVAGALLGETLLIGAFGVRGTALVAAAIDLSVAAVAGGLFADAEQPAAVGGIRRRVDRRTALTLAAAAGSGAALLALEVVWFRFLLFWIMGTSLAFALMLGVVLAGIGMGGLAAGAALRIGPAERFVPALAAAAAFVTIVGYAGFGTTLAGVPGGYTSGVMPSVRLCVFLMLPTCLLSGALFTLVGHALQEDGDDASVTSGRLTLANTIGAAAGAILGGLWLLPALGVERSLCALACLYVVIAGLLAAARRRGSAARGERLVEVIAGAAAVLALVLFPFGLMRGDYARRLWTRWVVNTGGSFSLRALREGVNETAGYVEERLWDEPVSERLFMNAASMSATTDNCARYMRLFVHLPLAFRPDAGDALLISYGVGSTADALVHARGLRSIDVVDISRDALELGRIVYPAPGTFPLDDPRVRVTVEDGRFFLLTTRRTYDLITAEPPPPKSAGIVNLYSKEYFALARARLNPGGLVSYWLPVAQMAPREAKAIAGAFCAVFSDCTLWSGAGPEWILLGAREPMAPVSEEAFTRQWRDSDAQARLARIGVEEPEQLPALFLADAEQLAQWTAGVPVLDDDHPRRLGPIAPPALAPEYVSWSRLAVVGERLAQSRFVARVVPPEIRRRALERLAGQEPGLTFFWTGYAAAAPPLALLDQALATTSYRSPVVWLMGSQWQRQDAALRARQRGIEDDLALRLQAVDAMAARDYAAAEAALARIAAPSDEILAWRVLASELGGAHARAQALLAERPGRDTPDWAWLRERVGRAGSSHLTRTR